MRLNDSQRWTIINGLRLASEAYARFAIEAQEAGHPSIANQFLRQIADADTLARYIEDSPDDDDR